MSLVKLTISNVRNIVSAKMEPASHINLIVGENASGKSTVLEAIYLLGRGKSFRTNVIQSVINDNYDNLIVSGQTIKPTKQKIQLGIKFERQNREIHINGQPANSRSQLIKALPVQLIAPHSHTLLESGPKHRRQFLDWGVFHHDDEFIGAWKRYKRALEQRNALLKKGNTTELKIWDQELVQYGTMVADKRSAYIENLTPMFIGIAENVLNLKNYKLHHYCGWETAIGLEKTLHTNLVKDCRYGHTQYGPHRGDFQLEIDGKLAKNFISRGQTKLLVIALKLAQMMLLGQKTGSLLIDDLASELDVNHRLRVLEVLNEIKTQIFITAIRLEDIGMLHSGNEKIFHIKQGVIQQIESNQESKL